MAIFIRGVETPLTPCPLPLPDLSSELLPPELLHPVKAVSARPMVHMAIRVAVLRGVRMVGPPSLPAARVRLGEF
jgi:hypothetical protein